MSRLPSLPWQWCLFACDQLSFDLSVFTAFRKVEMEPGVFTMSAEEYVPLFTRLGVTCVVRFNTKCYDRNVFLRAGIQHVDLYYEDGGNPTPQILNAFLQTCERARGVVAVHCKAGLGRTGTNIVAYMMKHYGYTAREGIAWARICRPGSVVGMQQQYLVVSCRTNSCSTDCSEQLLTFSFSLSWSTCLRAVD